MKKFSCYLKQKYLLLGFFCLFVEFAGDSVGCIEFQNGRDEQQHHPVVVDVIDVGGVALGSEFQEQRHDEMAGILDHENGGEHEQHVGKNHDAAQPQNGGVVALVALLQLQGCEGECAYGENPRGAHKCAEHIQSGADYHQHRRKKKKNALVSTQLFHHYQRLDARRRSV